MAAGSIFKPIAKASAKSLGTVADRQSAAAEARADQLARYRQRSVQDPAVAAARQAKLDAQVLREHDRRIARDTEVQRVRDEHAAEKARRIADVAAREAEAAQLAADVAAFAAQAEADKIALVALRKSQRDARYAKRALKAKTSR